MFGMSKAPPPSKKRKAKPAAAAAHAEPEAPADDEEEATLDVSIPLTTAQHAKLARLGGVKWIQAQIDKAKAGSA